ncbi:unnamed protein product [Cuscuta campestris]|uniref:AB hydrolase-1 domain-containing protein n=1 Tax=Cuscuta campestris TaxID=132261 RepID=A0A484KW19_9ASTE|nr:unnamed protein product [Cuscuta campestris]
MYHRHFLRRLLAIPATVRRRSLSTLAFDEIRSPPDRSYKFTAFVLHGLLGSGRNWRSFSRSLASSLPSGWRMILVDLRNHGRSAEIGCFEQPHTMENAANDLANLIESQGWDWPDVVIGHSMGGKVALQFAQSCSRGDYGQPAQLPKQSLVLTNMVITRSSNTNSNPEDNQENPFGKDPLATIASRLAALDVLQEKVTALEANSSRRNSGKGKQRNRADDSDEEYESSRRASRLPHAKLEFPKFTGGDPRGWILKAEKYFRYYDVPEDDKVDVASMYLEGDALGLFSWMSTERTLFYWEDLVKAFQEHNGPPEYQNPNEYLCSIKQSGTVTEYRLEFARRASRVERWPEHCLLGVFINGLKEELRPDVRLHKPQTVYRAASLALEFERKQPSSRGSRSNAAFGPNRSNPLYPQNYSTREQKGKALLADPFTATIIQNLKENTTSRPGYTLVEQRLYFNGRLVIPESSSLRAKLLEEAHNTPCGGHGGFLKTLKRLSNTVYWPRMKLDVKRLVQQCFICQKSKYEADISRTKGLNRVVVFRRGNVIIC